MVYVNNSNELYHYGVKGMRWGHRKSAEYGTVMGGPKKPKMPGTVMGGPKQKQTISGDNSLGQKYRDAKANLKAANKAFNTAYKKGSNSDIVKTAEAAESAKDAYKQAKKDRKAALKSTYKQLNREASFAEKLNGNNATRKLAAKYIVDNGMTVSEAKTKAYGVAKRNSAIILAAYGAMAVGSALANRR